MNPCLNAEQDCQQNEGNREGEVGTRQTHCTLMLEPEQLLCKPGHQQIPTWSAEIGLRLASRQRLT